MIQIQSLSHRYPKAETAALDNVSFDIADGACLGLLGHNGAGKTTLMSLLAGLQEVRQGEILFDGKPLRLLSRSERQKIGLVPQDFAFYPQLSVWDNLLFFASLYKVRDKGRLNAQNPRRIHIRRDIRFPHNPDNGFIAERHKHPRSRRKRLGIEISQKAV